MAWTSPKTDWTISTVFAYSDYNRIKNNLLYLNDMLNTAYPDLAVDLDFGDDLDYESIYSYGIFNAFEEALVSFERIGTSYNIGSSKTYKGNDNFIDYAELNRIEKCCLRWYNMNPPISSATISPSTVELNSGDTQQFSITISPTGATYTVEWSSSSNAKVTIDSNGLATAVEGGSAVITAVIKQGNTVVATAESTVTVIIPATAISLVLETSLTDGMMLANNQYVFRVDTTPANASNRYDYVITDSYDDMEIVSQTDNKFIVMFNSVSYSEGSHALPYSYVEDFDNLGNATIEITLDDLTASSSYTIKPVGTWFEYTLDSSTYRSRYSFIYIGNNIDGTNIATLYPVHIGTGVMTGIFTSLYDNGLDEIEDFMNTNFSSTLLNALKKASKVVMNGTGKKTVSRKYFLPSHNELGFDNSFGQTGEIIQLGSKTYPTINAYTSDVYTIYNGSSQSVNIALRSFCYYEESDLYYQTIYNSSGLGLLSHDIESVVSTDALPLRPLFFLSNAIKVKKEEYYTDQDIYYIDWTNSTDSVKLSSIPLGSIIMDITGNR